MEIKTKAQYAEQVRAEHLSKALCAPDTKLKEWSLRVYSQFRAADNAWLAARTTAQELDRVRQDARSVHRRRVTPENTAAWRASVTAVEEANNVAREVRGQRNYLSALSELLATLLRERRTAAGNTEADNPSEDATNSDPLPINNDTAAPGTSTATGATTSEAVTAAAPPAARESCPFCSHTYTVRDGTLPQFDAEGNRLQLRKCMCRELAPPCKNCPICKVNPKIMKAKGDAQSRLCREEFKCSICACECPGAGKWVQGDEDSRARFRERTARRHAELSALLQGSWDDNTLGVGAAAAAATATTTALNGPTVTMRRLPQDIKDQIIAARAAESLFSALDSTAAVDGGSGGAGGLFGGSLSGAATTSAHNTGGCCGRMCCGEAITTVKRRKLENNPSTEYGRGRGRRNATSTRDSLELPALIAPAAAPSHQGANAGSPHHNEGCGDHCEHEEHHHHHSEHDHDESHHHHVHRCNHPHDECTSGCCSAVSNT